MEVRRAGRGCANSPNPLNPALPNATPPRGRQQRSRAPTRDQGRATRRQPRRQRRTPLRYQRDHQQSSSDDDANPDDGDDVRSRSSLEDEGNDAADAVVLDEILAPRSADNHPDVEVDYLHQLQQLRQHLEQQQQQLEEERRQLNQERHAQQQQLLEFQHQIKKNLDHQLGQVIDRVDSIHNNPSNTLPSESVPLTAPSAAANPSAEANVTQLALQPSPSPQDTTSMLASTLAALIHTDKSRMYDGKTNYSAYHALFEIRAAREGWSDTVKCDRLIDLLTGEATEVISHLRESNEPLTYARLHAALSQRFDKSRTRHEIIADLVTSKQQPGQSLADYARNILSLGNQLYPTTPEHVRQEILRKIFYQGLASPTDRLKLSLTGGNTIQAAMAVLQNTVEYPIPPEISSLLTPQTTTATDKSTKKVKLTMTTSPSTPSTSSTQPSTLDNSTLDKLEQLTKMMTEMQTRQIQSSNASINVAQPTTSTAQYSSGWPQPSHTTAPAQSYPRSHNNPRGRGGHGGRGGGRGGQRGRPRRNDAPIICNYCNKPNHTERQCWNNPTNDGSRKQYRSPAPNPPPSTFLPMGYPYPPFQYGYLPPPPPPPAAPASNLQQFQNHQPASAYGPTSVPYVPRSSEN